MKHMRLAASVALLGIFGSAMAEAAVTPEEVWQNWQKLSASYGQAMMADSVTREGDTLVVRNMKTVMEQDGASMTASLDEIRFRDLGDGTVGITMSDTYVVNMKMPGDDGATEEIAGTILQAGASMVAGGDANQTTYNYLAPELVATMQALQNGAVLADLKADLSGITGSYNVKTEGDRTLASATTEIGTLGFVVKALEGGDSFDMTGSLSALRVDTGGTFLGMAAMEDMAQALKDGVDMYLWLSYGAGSFEVQATEGGKPVKVSASNESGYFNFGLSGQVFHYATGGAAASLVASGGDIPFPEVRLSYGEAAFDMLIPVSRTEAPTNFNLLAKIVDLSVSEDIWGMADPTGALPHDPATLIIDTKGMVRLTTDLFDEAAMAAMGEAPPGEMHALTISDLTMRFGGAELTGTGDFTFDNTDLTTFDGIPAPTGRIDLVLRGGNGLLDKLVAMGLVPSEDAMGMRMMLAMFAKPGEGPDVLNSSLEFKDKGFFANGQRLQ